MDKLSETLEIGRFNHSIINRVVDFGLYLKIGDQEVLLPSKYVPKKSRPGDVLRVFVYTDSEDRPIATTLAPKAAVDDFAYLNVKDVTSIGAFLDWGLEKDLLLPRNEQKKPVSVGQRIVAKVCLDELTKRVYATTRIEENCRPPKNLSEGQQVHLLIYAMTNIGILAVVNNRYAGMLYRNETFTPLSIGDTRKGYIHKIRNDGKIDLSLKKPGYRSIDDSSNCIMDKLVHQGGFIPCHDKSPPEQIQHIFSMSKKEFKRAVGRLYKTGKIDLTGRGIRIKRQVD